MRILECADQLKGAGHAFLFQDATQVGQTADSFLRASDQGLG
jgi:hypothetical protein